MIDIDIVCSNAGHAGYINGQYFHAYVAEKCTNSMDSLGDCPTCGQPLAANSRDISEAADLSEGQDNG